MRLDTVGMGMYFVAAGLTQREHAEVVANPELTAGFMDDWIPSLHLDLAKDWHGVHFLLTGTAWEITPGLGEAIFGGDDIGDDLGYGSARLLQPGRVRAIADALRAVDIDTLRARWSDDALLAAEIYSYDTPDRFALDVLSREVVHVRKFYCSAADQGMSVLMLIT
jgi:hypothetical protein